MRILPSSAGLAGRRAAGDTSPFRATCRQFRTIRPCLRPPNRSDFPPIVLTFAASDPSGGAGMQADILTLASMGCHPLSVLTAITVQDTLGVEGVQPIDAEWVADQARCLLEDMPVDAFKIGVLGSVENIAAIAEILSDYPDVPLVLDPVLASGRGDELASDEMLARAARAAAAADDDPHAEQHRSAASGRRRRRRRAVARGVRAAPDRDGLRVRAHHRHARADAAGRQHALRQERRGAQRQLGAAAGELSRLGLHARLRDRGDARQRARPARGGARSAGIHLAHAAPRRTGRAWASTSPIVCSGRATTSAEPPVERGSARPTLRRHYASPLHAGDRRPVRADARPARHRRAPRARRRGARWRRGGDPVSQQDRLAAAAARAGARAARSVRGEPA